MVYLWCTQKLCFKGVHYGILSAQERDGESRSAQSRPQQHRRKLWRNCQRSCEHVSEHVREHVNKRVTEEGEMRLTETERPRSREMRLEYFCLYPAFKFNFNALVCGSPEIEPQAAVPHPYHQDSSPTVYLT